VGKKIQYKKMTFDEWDKKGIELFGEDRLKWKFKCPICGHVASVQDYKDAGAQDGAVGYSCIGRWVGAKRKAFEGHGKGPCDYAGGGLFAVNPIIIIMKDNTEHHVFEFATMEVPMRNA